MTSKGLFFKYMRENTKQRLWSVALTALLCFFLFPVLTALETSIMLRPDNLSKDLSVEAALAEAKLKLTNEMLHMYSIQNAMLVFILIVAAVVLAASGFSYLHSKKKTDFFHSLPISREMLYTVTGRYPVSGGSVSGVFAGGRCDAAGEGRAIFMGNPADWVCTAYVLFYPGVHDGGAGSDSDRQSDRRITWNRRIF